MKEESANKQVNNPERSMLKLSEDIGKMADRIGVMADRIGTMADRILETQKIQHQNIELMQKSMLEIVNIMNEQLKANNKIVELLINKGGGLIK
ncbi:MAG: hypothetical protein BWK79_07875 [Beggiatoa sp. IS2]|nr:MAG: hypothetical protein BWK79_07875 [Beggiatoa sp. IS2]